MEKVYALWMVLDINWMALDFIYISMNDKTFENIPDCHKFCFIFKHFNNNRHMISGRCHYDRVFEI